jgi:DNA-binding winged helix-turn-helix (wHTH) protein
LKIPQDVYWFGEFELDRRAYRLCRNGRPIQLERRPLDVLFPLLEWPRELLTRQEIHDRVWGANVFLDIDNAINTAVRKLRTALHDEPGSPHFSP